MQNLSLNDITKVSGGNDDDSTNEKIGEGVTDALNEIGEIVDNLIDKIKDEHSN